MLRTFIQIAKRMREKFIYCSVILGFSVLLSACQDKDWHVQTATVGTYSITAEFPSEITVFERSYQLLDEADAGSLDMLQWYAADGENSFNLSYIIVPAHLDANEVATEFLRSMTLKRDPRLKDASTELKERYEEDLPSIGEQFNASVGLDSKRLVATAQVIQKANLVVQVYTAGPESNTKFSKQSQRFFEQIKIGDTIN